jgi:dinuclear metal center YbgI/SA1388 family protein
MTISTIISELEKLAPIHLQEDYDNAGLITGSKEMNCIGALLTLDVTEDIIEEAERHNCNLIIAHHPIVFKGLKKINGINYVERIIIKAIKKDIAIYACHTNLDNVINGVNGKIADKLGLINRQILNPKPNQLEKLIVFAPENEVHPIEKAIFEAGAGHIGHYSECSFISEGTGSFKPELGANPYSGQIGIRSSGQEKKIEVIYPSWKQSQVLNALKHAHPYEEVAHEIIKLNNIHQEVGSGLVGYLPNPIPEIEFMELLKAAFNLKVIRHTQFLGKMVEKVALCGGAGSFLTKNALLAKADAFVTADMKYHEFFDADNQLLIADIGHFESEQFTIELFHDVLKQKFPNFALLKSGVNTNPVYYFTGE